MSAKPGCVEPLRSTGLRFEVCLMIISGSKSSKLIYLHLHHLSESRLSASHQEPVCFSANDDDDDDKDDDDKDDNKDDDDKDDDNKDDDDKDDNKVEQPDDGSSCRVVRKSLFSQRFKLILCVERL